MTDSLDRRALKLNDLEEKERKLDLRMNTQLPVDDVEDEDPMNDPVLGPVLRDLAEYNKLQSEFESQ